MEPLKHNLLCPYNCKSKSLLCILIVRLNHQIGKEIGSVKTVFLISSCIARLIKSIIHINFYLKK